MLRSPTAIPPEELGRGSRIALEIVDTDVDLYHHMAWTMLDALRANNTAGRPTVFIVPVGPVGQYRRFAALCNRYDVSCRDLYLFNMDEYLQDDGTYVPEDHPLSFRGFMEREYRMRIREDLRPAPDHVIFPDPARPQSAAERMAELGGVEICFGGVGINGHIAFNEPPEPGETVTNEEFRERPTRVLPLARESRTINAHTAGGGDLQVVPRLAITLGMRELLAARKLRFYLNRPWQRAVVRRILHGPVTAALPASFLQEHDDARLVITREVSELPVARLA
ncbi:MAG: glucosamine-6-phosphate isomerase [Anaerolineae bacterium]|nr:glucosamine-6-phosphate isomerase [Anaerolineae bacterium]